MQHTHERIRRRKFGSLLRGTVYKPRVFKHLVKTYVVHVVHPLPVANKCCFCTSDFWGGERVPAGSDSGRFRALPSCRRRVAWSSRRGLVTRSWGGDLPYSHSHIGQRADRGAVASWRALGAVWRRGLGWPATWRTALELGSGRGWHPSMGRARNVRALASFRRPQPKTP